MPEQIGQAEGAHPCGHVPDEILFTPCTTLLLKINLPYADPFQHEEAMSDTLHRSSDIVYLI